MQFALDWPHMRLVLQSGDRETVRDTEGERRVTVEDLILDVGAQSVAAVEELADVSAIILFQSEDTTRMSVLIMIHFDNKVVQDNKRFFFLVNTLNQFFNRHFIFRMSSRLYVPWTVTLPHLQRDFCKDEHH